ncbi:MAG: multicopper oxidase family protein [Acidimicrobiales bacterium]
MQSTRSDKSSGSGLSRRDFVKAGVFAGAAVAIPLHRLASAQTALANRMPQSKLPVPFTRPFQRPPVAAKFRTDATTDYYKIPMVPFLADIIPGYQTPMYGYDGSFPGPTIKTTKGRKTAIRFGNELPSRHQTLLYEPYTSVHLHGSPSLPQYDGYASDITRPGQYKDYHYPNNESGRTLWYHDHGMHHTAENIVQGLAGMYIHEDPAEAALGLPRGEFDVPLMINDAIFKNDGNLLFSLEDESGQWGDVIMVNGVPWPAMKVKRRKYRFRVLNASISRSFELSLSNGQQMTVIGTDAGLMPHPVKTSRLRLAGAERYEVVIDFAKLRPGTRVQLRNSSPKNNVNYLNTDRVMAFDVVGDPFDATSNGVPSELNPTNKVMALQPSQATTTRQFRLFRDRSQWTINGNTWAKVTASNYNFVEASVPNGAVEIWEFINDSGGWFHPIHIHLIDFKILSRNGQAPQPYEAGAKDVIYLGENETVQVLAQFKGNGKYMIHCHNMIHEDHDMMTQFEVVDPDMPADHPLSDPCRNMPEESEL